MGSPLLVDLAGGGEQRGVVPAQGVVDVAAPDEVGILLRLERVDRLRQRRLVLRLRAEAPAFEQQDLDRAVDVLGLRAEIALEVADILTAIRRCAKPCYFAVRENERVFYWWRGPAPRDGVRLEKDQLRLRSYAAPALD